MPKEGENFVSFKTFEKQPPVPIVIHYADFESFTTKIQSCENQKFLSAEP